MDYVYITSFVTMSDVTKGIHDEEWRNERHLGMPTKLVNFSEYFLYWGRNLKIKYKIKYLELMHVTYVDW